MLPVKDVHVRHFNGQSHTAIRASGSLRMSENYVSLPKADLEPYVTVFSWASNRAETTLETLDPYRFAPSECSIVIFSTRCFFCLD